MQGAAFDVSPRFGCGADSPSISESVSQQRHLEEENAVLKEELQKITAQLVGLVLPADML